jgi:hypothetical protein
MARDILTLWQENQNRWAVAERPPYLVQSSSQSTARFRGKAAAGEQLMAGVAQATIRSTIPWEGGSWRTADGRRCSGDDPERDYMVTRLGNEVPRLFIEEMERVEDYVREHPYWAQEQRESD